MPVCGYVVVAGPGEAETTASALSRIDGCEVVPSENRDILLLVTCTASDLDDRDLRRRLDDVPGIQALLMTFGEIDPESPIAQPVPEGCP
ncbi:MAG TPA: hypothetical protein VLA43_05105 [Longimicrobiales bacterium]|nr:hypothetical protein [Longimicrobiales bacterium]